MKIPRRRPSLFLLVPLLIPVALILPTSHYALAGEQVITDPNSGFEYFFPTYSPDGQWIAYVRLKLTNGVKQIRKFRLDGSDDTLLLKDPGILLGVNNESPIRWSPVKGPDDYYWIAYASPSTLPAERVWVVRADDDGLISNMIAHPRSSDPLDTRVHRQPRWSFDGRYLVFERWVNAASPTISAYYCYSGITLPFSSFIDDEKSRDILSIGPEAYDDGPHVYKPVWSPELNPGGVPNDPDDNIPDFPYPYLIASGRTRPGTQGNPCSGEPKLQALQIVDYNFTNTDYLGPKVAYGDNQTTEPGDPNVPEWKYDGSKVVFRWKVCRNANPSDIALVEWDGTTDDWSSIQYLTSLAVNHDPNDPNSPEPGIDSLPSFAPENTAPAGCNLVIFRRLDKEPGGFAPGEIWAVHEDPPHEKFRVHSVPPKKDRDRPQWNPAINLPNLVYMIKINNKWQIATNTAFCPIH